jgi:ubiquinone/menaquinone biosynthesis C-methylase UbiE
MWPNKRSAAEIARIFGTRDVLATYHFLGRLGGLIMAGSNRACAERAIGLLEVRPQDRVLEVGFGPGVAIELLARVPARHVVGVDPSTEMLEQAAVRNAAGVASGRVELQQGSVERLPFADATYSGQPRTGVVETLAAARFAKAHLVESETAFCALATKP